MKRTVLLWAGMLSFAIAGTANAAFIDFKLAPFDTCSGTSCTRNVGGVQVTVEGWTDVNNDNALDPLVDTPAPLWWDNLDGFGVQSNMGYEADEIDGPEFLVVRFGSTQTISQLSFTDLFYEGSPAYQEIGYYRLTAGGVTGGLVQFLADVSQLPGSTNGVLNLAVANLPAETVTFTAPGHQGTQNHEYSVSGVNATVLSANLSINKADSPDPVTVGQNLTYTITVSNAGPDKAYGVSVSDNLPGGVTFVSVTPSQGSCTGTSSISCSLGTINSGGNATVTIVVTPNATGTLNNTATVTSATKDPNTSNNTSSASTTVNGLSADLSITKTAAPNPVIVGQNLTYSITVTNNGPNTASNVVVTDTLPGSVNFVSASPSQGSCTPSAGTVTCNLGNLANGANATISIVVTPTTVGTIGNSASVASSTSDPNAGNNTVGPVNTTVNGSADLSITKSDSPDPVLVGQNLTYTITVTNNGPTAADNVVVSDTLPAGVTFVSSTPSQGSCSGTSTVTCNLGTVPYPGNATVTIVVTPTVAGNLSNSASVTSGTNDPNNGNNNSGPVSTTVNAPSANLSITKTDSPDPVTVGNQLTYSISVTNLGPDTAANVVVTDNLPGSVTFVSATPSQGSCSGTSSVTCNLGSIPFPGGATVTIVVTPTVNGPLSNTATVSSSTNDPAPGNNSSTTSTTVNPATPQVTDLQVTQSVNPNPVDVGLNATFTIVVTNNGPGTATGVTLTNTLPSDVTFVSNNVPPPTQGVCNAPSGGQFMCSLGTIPNGGNVTITLVVMTNTAGMIQNSVSVAGVETESSITNNFASQTANVGDVSRLLNISARAAVGTSQNVLVGGFVLGGNLPKQLLIRGYGPTLQPAVGPGVLPDPVIELYADHDNNPLTPAILILTNNDWGTPQTSCPPPALACGTVQDIIDTGMSADSYAPTDPNRGKDSAILVTLPPGSYPITLHGAANASGVGLIAINDVDGTTLPKLVNISARGQVLTGSDVIVGGFIIGGGTAPKQVMIRGYGPTLEPAVGPGVLADPVIDLYGDDDNNPLTPAVLIMSNDDWGTAQTSCPPPALACGTVQDIIDTGLSADSYAPTDPNRGKDAAILVTLPPGAYPVTLRGAGGLTGVGLIAVNDLDP